MTESLPTASALSAPALAASLQRGQLALFPTDTLPALAAIPAAAERLWILKARPATKPLILMGADAAGLFAALEQPLHPDWIRMAQRVWPGACTLVLPASGSLVACLHPQGGSIGLRVPAFEPALALLRITGPLATTSANRSGEEPCRTVEAAAAVFPELPRLGPLPWPAGKGTASTVLRWVAPGDWQVLRPGPVMPELDGASAPPEGEPGWRDGHAKGV